MARPGAVPEGEIPNSISGVVAAYEPRMSNLERANTTVMASVERMASSVMEIHAQGIRNNVLLESLDAKMTSHIEVSLDGRMSTERRIQAIELARAGEAGGDRVTADIKKAWIVPLGRAALAAVLVAGLAGMVAMIVMKTQAPAAPVDYQALAKALKEIP